MDKEFKDEYDREFSRDTDIPDSELTEDQQKQRDLHTLTVTLSSERTQAVNDKKESIEARLVDSARSYKGVRDNAGKETLDEQFDSPKVYNRVFHNITRQITNDGASQLGDLLFPSDDKNYGLNPAPIAEPPLAVADEPAVGKDNEKLTDAEGNQLTNQQAHNRRVERAARKTKRMFTKLDASLILAKYPQKGRKCILNAAIYGTGILKGPVPNKLADKWAKRTDGKHGLKPTKELSPDLKVVSPFDFFPDMSATEPEEWGYTWERSFILPSKLQALINKRGFDASEVNRLLRAGPSVSNTLSDSAREAAREDSHNKNLADNRFELWERHGHIERKYLEAAGIATDGEDVWVPCVVYMIEERVLKVSIRPYERDDTLYSIFNWDEDPLSVFGYGIPHLMSDPQHVYNTAWRMMLDNAGVSTLPQIVIDKNSIKPADGTTDYSIKSGKVWTKTGEIYSNERQDKPFELFTIKQDIQQLFNILDKAEQDAYSLTGVTRVDKAQQMNDNAPVTLGATQIQQNNSSVSRRSQARRYDDQITATLISRYYDFFMQFEDDDDIKTIMTVEPRGSTILLSKELQATNLMQFFQMTEGGQIEGVKQLKLLRAISTSMQHPEGLFIDTDDEMSRKAEEAANQEPPVDPMLEIEGRKIDVEEARVELEQGKLQLLSQEKQANYDLKVAELERKFELEYAKLDVNQRKELDKSDIEFAKIEQKATFDYQAKQLQEQTKRDTVAAKIGADREKQSRSEGKLYDELMLRKQAEDRQDAELHHKITTGQPGI